MSPSSALRRAALAAALALAACASKQAGPGGGGTPGTGGSSGQGGTNGGFATASMLPDPPGPGGIARPSGTPGGLTSLDWAGFKAAVSYTFDDSNSSQIAHYDELQALGVHMTFYLITSKPESSNRIWAQAITDGHEIGNHSNTHPQVGTAEEVDTASTFIQETFGVTAWTMASPFGDASYPPLATTRFLANRGVNNGLIGPKDSTNPFNLYCYVPPAAATAAMFNAETDAARAAGKWKIVLVHGFIGGTDGAFQAVDLAEFTSAVGYTEGAGRRLDRQRGQRGRLLARAEATRRRHADHDRGHHHLDLDAA